MWLYPFYFVVMFALLSGTSPEALVNITALLISLVLAYGIWKLINYMFNMLSRNFLREKREYERQMDHAAAMYNKGYCLQVKLVDDDTKKP
jgi:hypothetical protein